MLSPGRIHIMGISKAASTHVPPPTPRIYIMGITKAASNRPRSVLILAHHLDMHSDIASCSDPWDPVPDLYNFCLPLLQPKMVHPVSSVGLCTAAVSPFKAAANTNALAWMGLWAAYPCAAWTCACPALTAPSREGSNCLGNAVRSGCVTSPRTTQQLALP